MRAAVRVVAVLLLVGGAAAGALWFLSEPEPPSPKAPPPAPAASAPPKETVPQGRSDPKVPLFSDGYLDDSGYDLAFRYSLPVPDRSDFAACLRSADGRAARGVEEVKRLLAQLERVSPPPADLDHRRAMLQSFVGLLFMYEGRFDEASSWFVRAQGNPGISPEVHANMIALDGVAWLRRGEIENCVACLGPSTCIFPIAPEAVHLKVEGSRGAIERFTRYLEKRPDDVGVRWLLNLAYMTLGEHPEKVPAEYRISLSSVRSGPPAGFPRFANIGATCGIESRGANMLGGALFDDFTGDGKPDALVVSGDWDLGGSLFVNKGDGTFEDRGVSAGLSDLKMAVNLTHADFDNDGHLDALALRGGWETPYPLTLLRNKGDGSFEDVTRAAGFGEPIASQTAAWGDFDRDGRIDVYVGGEYHDRNATPSNLGRLYRNLGDGTFENVAARAGVENARWAKGVAWGDCDADGDPDLYVSNMNGPNRLYRNNGDGTFTDVAIDLGLTEPERSFSCWFWDYDEDGRLDIFVSGFGCSLLDIVSDMLGKPAKGERPRLYRNLGRNGFKDVSSEVGLDRVTLPMGSNFADLDNDGWLDVYLATGRPPYSLLIPNLMFRNAEGRRFDDVTMASGTGHLQKGHAVAFADMDADGDQDLFVEIGGQTPGDKAHNVLFQNPGVKGRHWLAVRLVGTRANRAAIGASVTAEFVGPNGVTRKLHRVVSGGSSFGGNSLTVSLGLGEATAVKTLTVQWPSPTGVETFRDIPADRRVEILEGSGSVRASR